MSYFIKTSSIFGVSTLLHGTALAHHEEEQAAAIFGNLSQNVIVTLTILMVAGCLAVGAWAYVFRRRNKSLKG